MATFRRDSRHDCQVMACLALSKSSLGLAESYAPSNGASVEVIAT